MANMESRQFASYMSLILFSKLTIEEFTMNIKPKNGPSMHGGDKKVDEGRGQ